MLLNFVVVVSDNAQCAPTRLPGSGCPHSHVIRSDVRGLETARAKALLENVGSKWGVVVAWKSQASEVTFRARVMFRRHSTLQRTSDISQPTNNQIDERHGSRELLGQRRLRY
jgi:hypothetical protein